MVVSHNEKAVSGDYDIFGGFLIGLGTLAKVRVCPPEVRVLPGSTASEGHLDRALKDITNREAANNDSSLTMTLQIWTLESKHSFGFQLA